MAKLADDQAAGRLHQERERTLQVLWRDFARRYRRACLLGQHVEVGIKIPIRGGVPNRTYTRIQDDQVRVDAESDRAPITEH